MKAFEERTWSPGHTEALQRSQGPGLAEVLHALDDQTLRMIFKMSPQLTVNDLRHDGEALADQSPSMKGGD